MGSDPRTSTNTEPVRLLFVGDVSGARDIVGVEDPFRHVAPRIRSADIAFANFECAVEPRTASVELVAPPSFPAEVAQAGFDVVSLANNHTWDAGVEGFDRAKNLLESEGVLTVGNGPPAFKTVRGVRFGFLAYISPKRSVAHSGVSVLDHRAYLEVRYYADRVDCLIVSVHWGDEYGPANDDQRRMAQALMGAGANIVVGHHPHVAQEIEPAAPGGWVFYSLGNFLFDSHKGGDATRHGFAATVDVGSDGSVLSVNMEPYTIDPYLRPRWHGATKLAGGSRTLYHIGKRPAQPKPKRAGWRQRGQDTPDWVRPWLDAPVQKGVFLTPNPFLIAPKHGVFGHVYAYKVPNWVLREAGGIHRHDGGSEVLIPEPLWKHVRFVGKSMDRAEFLDRVYQNAFTESRASTYRVAAKYKNKKRVKNKDGDTVTVYEYSEGQVKHRNREKAKRVEALRGRMADLRKQVRKDLESDDPRTRLTALAVALIDQTYARVGNDRSAQERGHRGITTLSVEHVTLGKGKATLRYTGKSGVEQEKVVTDAATLKALKAAMKGRQPKDKLLCDGDKCSVRARHVNNYLRDYQITAKDLRGMHANDEMRSRLKTIRKGGPDLPRARKERDAILKEEFKRALEETAGMVGHTPSTLRGQYLVPGLEPAYMKDGTVIDKLDKKATLSDAEKEDREDRRLHQPSPKKKPPRNDLRRRTVQDRDTEEDPDVKQDKKDRSQNYKDAAARLDAEWGELMFPSLSDVWGEFKYPRLAAEAKKDGQSWKTQSGWNGKYDGKIRSFDTEDAAKAYATGQSAGGADTDEGGNTEEATPEKKTLDALTMFVDDSDVGEARAALAEAILSDLDAYAKGLGELDEQARKDLVEALDWIDKDVIETLQEDAFEAVGVGEAENPDEKQQGQIIKEIQKALASSDGQLKKTLKDLAGQSKDRADEKTEKAEREADQARKKVVDKMVSRLNSINVGTSGLRMDFLTEDLPDTDESREMRKKLEDAKAAVESADYGSEERSKAEATLADLTKKAKPLLAKAQDDFMADLSRQSATLAERTSEYLSNPTIVTELAEEVSTLRDLLGGYDSEEKTALISDREKLAESLAKIEFYDTVATNPMILEGDARIPAKNDAVLSDTDRNAQFDANVQRTRDTLSRFRNMDSRSREDAMERVTKELATLKPGTARHDALKAVETGFQMASALSDDRDFAGGPNLQSLVKALDSVDELDLMFDPSADFNTPGGQQKLRRGMQRLQPEDWSSVLPDDPLVEFMNDPEFADILGDEDIAFFKDLLIDDVMFGITVLDDKALSDGRGTAGEGQDFIDKATPKQQRRRTLPKQQKDLYTDWAQDMRAAKTEEEKAKVRKRYRPLMKELRDENRMAKAIKTDETKTDDAETGEIPDSDGIPWNSEGGKWYVKKDGEPTGPFDSEADAKKSIKTSNQVLRERYVLW